MAERVLRYTRVVRHPETFQAVALVAGSQVPGWAGGLVHEDDLQDAPKAQAAPSAPVVEDEAPSPAQEDAGEKPDKSWTGPRIRKYAEDNGIDLGGATTKADMLAAIEG